MKHFFNKPQFGENWFTYANFYKEIVSQLNNDSHIVEVGSWKGKSSVFMAVEIINSRKNIKFDCVDTWLGSQDGLTANNPAVINNTLYSIFLSNIEPVKHIINPIRMTSIEASKLYEDHSLDFVFIDAGHSYLSVKSDIEAWLPKLKHGGIFSGHDYNNGWPGVNKAVDEKFNKNRITAKEKCWIVKVK